MLRAVLAHESQFDIDSLSSCAAEVTLESGLGAVLAYVSRDSLQSRHGERLERIIAADIMARWTTDDLLETAVSVIAAAREIDCRPILMKGAATGLRYYPAPHLRLMTDIDLLIPPHQLDALESKLRGLGLEQTSHKPLGMYDKHHHSMPFFDERRDVWIELHTRPFPPSSPLDNNANFPPEGFAAHLSTLDVGGETAHVMNDEMQLVYTSARWAETLKVGRGVFPILDVALLLQTQGRTLDWERVCNIAHGSWAAGATKAMLSYLHRWRLADIPPTVLRRLASGHAIGNRLRDGVLSGLVTAFVISGRRPGTLLTPSNLRIIWSTLLREGSAWANVLALGPNIAFPSDRVDRFNLATAWKRVRSALGLTRTR